MNRPDIPYNRAPKICEMIDHLKYLIEQKKLFEDNHNLIYSYAKKKHISSEKWYDVLAIGLCKAARSFDPDKGKFSTWAYRFFDNEIRIINS